MSPRLGALLCLLAAGCMSTGVKQTYEGPRRTRDQVGVLWNYPSDTSVRIESLNGRPVRWSARGRRELEFEPGLVTVSVRRTWIGSPTLRMAFWGEAGEEYEIRGFGGPQEDWNVVIKDLRGWVVERAKPGPDTSSLDLGAAAASGASARVAELLKSDVALESRDASGHTPLMRAALHDQPGPALMLLRSGAKVSSSDAAGRQALHLAALHGNSTVGAILLRLRADVAAVDRDGQTPLSLALTEPHMAMVEQVIRRRGRLPVALPASPIDQTRVGEATYPENAAAYRSIADAYAELQHRREAAAFYLLASEAYELAAADYLLSLRRRTKRGLDEEFERKVQHCNWLPAESRLGCRLGQGLSDLLVEIAGLGEPMDESMQRIEPRVYRLQREAVKAARETKRLAKRTAAGR